MSRTDISFDSLRQAIQSLWPGEESTSVDVETQPGLLLLTLPNDIAAFSVFNTRPDEDFQETYSDFKRLYRENNRTWDERTLSFVICRSSEHSEDDRFYASLEHDPLFCRKYVIRAHDTVPAQRAELLRLPFFPLRPDDEHGLQRPQPAQDLLQSAGVSASLSRKFIEAGHRSAERIAIDLRDGNEPLPKAITSPRRRGLALTSPRAHSRVVSLTVEGFRVYKEAQKFDLDASVVVLYGPNGLGKTSVFDAIDYAATGRMGACAIASDEVKPISRDWQLIWTRPPVLEALCSDGRSGAPNSDPADWKLQRSTGTGRQPG